jgi:hypothetical protein
VIGAGRGRHLPARLLPRFLFAAALVLPVVAGAQAPLPAPPKLPPAAKLPSAPPGQGATALPTPAELDRMASDYRDYWERHPHGQWLLRLLPVRVAPSSLPQADSEPARLTALYCVQCHGLPSPAMHGPARWEQVVRRMLPRMRGEGNQGRLMKEMMRDLQAPDEAQVRIIVDYLGRHAQQPLPILEDPVPERNRGAPPTVPGRPGLTDALAREDGRMFIGACSQCHELPDPRSHRAAEWPAVVARMQDNMLWMNRVVGGNGDPREPRLEPQRIIAFLQAFASDAPAAVGGGGRR